MPRSLLSPSHASSSIRALLAAADWRDHPLGHPDTWPTELATAIGMALDSSFPMFVAWGPELSFFYNDAYARILGAKHPGALGLPFKEIWAEIWETIVPIIDRALSNKPAFFEDLPLTIVRQGYPEQAWFTFSYAPLRDGKGAVQGMYCTVVETTGRVRTERRAALELTLSDALRPLASPSDMLVTAGAVLGKELGLSRALYCEVDDRDGSFVILSQWTAAAMAALSRERFSFAEFGVGLVEALRTGATLVVDDTGADPRTAGFPRLYLQERIGAFITVPLVRQGRLLAFLSLNRAEPCRWSEDDVRFARDTAERTWAALDTARAQAALRAERDRSRYIFDTMLEGFSLMAPNWTITEMNAEGLRICNKTAGEVIGRDHWALFPEVRGSAAGDMLFRAMEERVPGAVDYQVPEIDGRGGWNEIRAFPTQDGGIAVFFRDITDRKRAEAGLRAADQRKDEFLAMLAHELRNPLAPISAAATLLDMGTLSEARVRQTSAIIGRQVRHMTRLVDDLLDVSRVTRGLVSLDMAPLDVRAVVDEAVEQVRPQLSVRRQRLGVHLPAHPPVVKGDRARLVQVLSNLLGNAIKYSPDERAIELSARVEGPHLVLTVADEGIGMERELTERAFDLFSQAKRSSDRSQGGLGLGLALVRNLVELHGGTVACASPGPGLGSTFTVTLPLTKEPTMPAAETPAPARTAAKLSVLLVDDNVDAAATLALLLREAGHSAQVEHVPEHALERARQLRPDACLLDIGLPGMDGNTLARRLRAQPETAHSTLIAISGYGQAADRSAALAAGFAHHLVKPVDFAALSTLLGTLRGVECK